jgi:NitT/TauT family transport system substrate-binding protein
MVDAFGGALTTAFFTNVDFATKNRDAVSRFSKAIVEASAYCNAHPAEMTEVMSSYTSIDKAMLADMVLPAFALNVDPRSFQPIVNAAAKYSVIDKAFNAQDLIFPIDRG